MASKFYKIILVGSLTYTVGRYKFIKGKEVKTQDADLLAHIKGDPRFEVTELGEVPKKEEAAKAPAPAPEGEADAAPKGAVGKAVAGVKSALSPKKNQSANAK